MLFLKQELERELQEGRNEFRANLEKQTDAIVVNILEILKDRVLPIYNENDGTINLEFYPDNGSKEYALYIYSMCLGGDIPIPVGSGIFKYMDFNVPDLDSFTLALYIQRELTSKLIGFGVKEANIDNDPLIPIEDDTADAVKRIWIKANNFDSGMCKRFIFPTSF